MGSPELDQFGRRARHEWETDDTVRGVHRDDTAGALEALDRGRPPRFPVEPERDWRYGDPAVVVSLDYERWVERPRRQGRHPVWEAMMREARGEPVEDVDDQPREGTA